VQPKQDPVAAVPEGLVGVLIEARLSELAELAAQPFR
jgi:hypothetical protein